MLILYRIIFIWYDSWISKLFFGTNPVQQPHLKRSSDLSQISSRFVNLALQHLTVTWVATRKCVALRTVRVCVVVVDLFRSFSVTLHALFPASPLLLIHSVAISARFSYSIVNYFATETHFQLCNVVFL